MIAIPKAELKQLASKHVMCNLSHMFHCTSMNCTIKELAFILALSALWRTDTTTKLVLEVADEVANEYLLYIQP